MYNSFPIDPDSIIGFSPAGPKAPDCGCEKAAEAKQPPCCPSARADRPNEIYAAMLRGGFSGRESELTLALCYLYQSIRFSCCSDELCALLFELALRKLRHLKLLGDLILSLGGDPKFFSSRPVNMIEGGWWNASPTVLRYPPNLGEALQSSLRREKSSAAEYKSLIAYLDDCGVSSALKEILSEKEQDIETLSQLYCRFCS